MNYLKVPNCVTYEQIARDDFVLAPSSLCKIKIKNKNVIKLSSFVNSKDKGIEIGSSCYTRNSNKYFIRTKAFNKNSWIIYPKGEETIISINPKYFKSFSLKEGDILISKDSNIGECVIIENSRYENDYMISGGIFRLKLNKNKFYIFAFMKSEFFKQQLLSLIPRGSTLKHAKEKFLDCLIPFPNGVNSNEIIKKVENIAKEIVLNEAKIRENDNKIMDLIDNELVNNQNSKKFSYDFPFLEDVKKTYRLDTGIYSEDYQKKLFLVTNYKLGFNNLKSLGFKNKRGTSLEINSLGTRIDSDMPKKGFYTLIIPTNISEYGTVEEVNYIGTKKELELIKESDIIFGGEGFEKGRCFVVCDSQENVATNYHGIRIYREKKNLCESIFVRCFLSYWRNKEMIDHIGVGGSGGHLAPEYFNYLLIPNFPKEIKESIMKLYFNREENGIYQLDRKNRLLKIEVTKLINDIVNDVNESS